MEKRALRELMIQRRLALEPAERDRLSAAAQDALVSSDWFRRAGTILLYQAFRGEVPTDRIAAAAVAAGKRLALPRVQKSPRRLWLHQYPGNPALLLKGAYGIGEPDPNWPLVPPAEIDLAVVPGVAFDRNGYRLGYGGGYYDRTLPSLKEARPSLVLVGLAFSFQLVETLPRDPHDVPVDAVATENGLVMVRPVG